MSNNTTVDPNEIAQEGQPETGLDTESKSNESQDILTEKEAEYVVHGVDNHARRDRTASVCRYREYHA